MLNTSYQRKDNGTSAIDMNQNHQLQPEISSSYSFSNYAKAGLAIAGTAGTVMLAKAAGVLPLLRWSRDKVISGNNMLDNSHSLINQQETITFNDNSLIVQPRHVKRASAAGEFQINTYITSDQIHSSVAALTSGDFVVVWCGTGQGENNGIYGQRFSSTGVPQGIEFHVNTYTSSRQQLPSVTGLTTGNFVVVWQSWEQDGYWDGVYGQRFSSTGVPQGTEFQINTYTQYNQHLLSVAALTSGDFVVVWTSDGKGDDWFGIYGRRYSGIGVPQGSEFQINTYTYGEQANPSVTTLSTSDFVVVWYGVYRGGIYGQRFSSTGVPQGSEFHVNTYTLDIQGWPSVTALSTGDFVVVWQSEGQDGSGYGIYGQRFSSTGVPQDSEFQINTYTILGQRVSSVAASPTGDFVVVWQSEGQDGSGDGIYGQRFSSTGVPLGLEFQINTYTTNAQDNPSIAILTTGDTVVVWQSEGQDGSDYGIYGHIYFENAMPPGLINNALLINKGASVILSTSYLSAVDPDNYDPELTFIVNNVQQGQFEHVSNEGVTITRFTQQEVIDSNIQFVHKGDTQLPKYSVEVTDGIVTTTSEAATIVYIAHHQLVVQPREAILLSNNQLNIKTTLVPTNLEISVSDTLYGHYERNEGSWEVTNVFDLSELNAGKIRFVHDGTENEPQYILQFKDLSENYIFPSQVAWNTVLNHPPKLVNPIGVLNKKINEAFSYALPNNIFMDPDNQLLQVSVKPLNSNAFPGWLQFNNKTITLAGSPVAIGSYGFKAIATDPYGATAEDRFYIDVKFTNGTNIFNESANPVPIVAAIAGGAALLTGGIIAGFWYRKNTKDQQTRKQHPFAAYVRSELKLEGLGNFATSKGAQYVLAINHLTAVLKDEYGIDVEIQGDAALKSLAKQVALAAKSQITPKKSGLFQKSAITVEDLSDANNAQAIARTVQRLGGGFDDVPIVENNSPADNNFGTLVEDGIDSVRQFFSPKAEFV